MEIIFLSFEAKSRILKRIYEDSGIPYSFLATVRILGWKVQMVLECHTGTNSYLSIQVMQIWETPLPIRNATL